MSDPRPFPPTDLARLTSLVARLRAPDGCPWDREQKLADLRAYLLEEAHEVAAAIDSGAPTDLVAELGDLLFQVAFIARLGEEQGEFTVADAIDAVEAKMIARHPHVFGGEPLADAAAVREAWERRKAREPQPARASLLDGATAASLPALVAAYRLTQKAAGVGFDWKRADDVLAKLDEELAELRHEMAEPGAPGSAGRIAEEVGDLLFTVANLARHLEIDPEGALARANLKFRRRFAAVEANLAAGGTHIADATLDEMEAAWAESKRRERE
ncbi:MAG: nucleoside triphosphate pyrophosphohydrolase [Thermoanaerobaculia bacterium]